MTATPLHCGYLKLQKTHQDSPRFSHTEITQFKLSNCLSWNFTVTWFKQQKFKCKKVKINRMVGELYCTQRDREVFNTSNLPPL